MKYEILQIKKEIKKASDSGICPWMYMNYKYAKEHGFTLLDYEVVYEGEVSGYNKKTSIFVLLEDLFEIFNIRRPEDFKGHSMSVSDVIRLEDGRTFYVDDFGFAPIE